MRNSLSMPDSGRTVNPVNPTLTQPGERRAPRDRRYPRLFAGYRYTLTAKGREGVRS